MDMKALIDTVASIGILSDFFDKNGEGAERVQERDVRVALRGSGTVVHKPLVPVLSYKERLKQMKAAAQAGGGSDPKTQRKKKKR